MKPKDLRVKLQFHHISAGLPFPSSKVGAILSNCYIVMSIKYITTYKVA